MRKKVTRIKKKSNKREYHHENIKKYIIDDDCDCDNCKNISSLCVIGEKGHTGP